MIRGLGVGGGRGFLVGGIDCSTLNLVFLMLILIGGRDRRLGDIEGHDVMNDD
jgi:hypothetical protein